MFRVLALVLLTSPAMAHSWYDRSCCGGRDCAPIPGSAVNVTDDGYEIHLEKGDHPLVKGPIFFTIPHGDPRIQGSPDGRYHGCVIPSSDGRQNFLCFFVPGAGASLFGPTDGAVALPGHQRELPRNPDHQVLPVSCTAS